MTAMIPEATGKVEGRRTRSTLQKVLRVPVLALTYVLLVPGRKLLEVTGWLPRLVCWLARFGRHGRGWAAMWEGYAPTAHDVIVGSYFKSGTNWTLQIAQQIAWRGNAEFEHIHDVVPWPDEVMKGYSIPLTDDRAAAGSPTGLRVIKTHAAFEDIPYSPAAKYVLVVRDPKDAFVSSYHFIKGAVAGPLMPGVATWLELFLSPAFPPGYWPRHAASYWRAREHSNVLYLTFKEMKEDLPSAVRRIAALLEVDLSEAEFARVCERSSFAYMKGIDSKFAPGALTPFSTGVSLVRKGAQGGAGEMLSLADQQRLDGAFREALALMGSDFDWDGACSPPSTHD